MPTYCFMCECGARTSMFLPFSKARERPACPKCQKKLERDFGAEMRPDSGCAAWPKVSWALAVHPEQAADARNKCRKYGVPTEYTAKGEPIFTSRNHRKKYCQTFGYYDRNAGYGDAAPSGKYKGWQD